MKCKLQNKMLNMPKDKIPKSRKKLRKLQRKGLKAKKNFFYRQNAEESNLKKQWISGHHKSAACLEGRIVHRGLGNLGKSVQNTNMKTKSTKEVKQENLEEDKIIKKLENNLKLRKNKGKCIPRMFVTDGLDYVLEACNIKDSKTMDYAQKMKLSHLNNCVKAVFPVNVKDTAAQLDINTEDCPGGCLLYLGKKEKSNTLKKQGDHKTCLNSIQSDEILKTNNTKRKAILESTMKNTELKKKGYTVKSVDYIGRMKIACEQENNETVVMQTETELIQKQIKGLLNRLAENNVKIITDKFEELYMSHSHNMVNRLLVRILIESLMKPIMLSEELIMVHALFVAVLHANVGDEVGAFVLEAFANKFHDLWKLQKLKTKQLDNILSTLCYLYNLKLMGAVVLYEILMNLTETFTEKEVELTILVLKTVGLCLRKEDPDAFKELILIVQKKAHELGALNINSRLKFLFDILLSVKNNNTAKIPGYDSTYCERSKKLLRGLVRQHVTQLRISLKDLLGSEKRGRWWEISAAIDSNQEINNEALFSSELMQIAKKQGMNTEIRQHTFCMLMTAEDSFDAFGKLIRMKVKNGQEREVVFVVLHCCLQEKVFNKFYTYIAKQLCEFDRKFRIATHFTIWDKLKNLQNLSDFQRLNLGRLLSSLVLQKCLNLSVLKVINFLTLNVIHTSFLNCVLSKVLLCESEEIVREVFKSLTISPKLMMFCMGLRLFLIQSFKCISKTSDFSLLQHRIKMAEKILIHADSKFQFHM